jgi:hypothetical protein
MFNTWIVRQDKCPKYNKSNTLLCPAIYCVKQNTVSTLAFNIHLFNFPFWTCCGRIMLRCAYPFIIFCDCPYSQNTLEYNFFFSYLEISYQIFIMVFLLVVFSSTNAKFCSKCFFEYEYKLVLKIFWVRMHNYIGKDPWRNEREKIRTDRHLLCIALTWLGFDQLFISSCFLRLNTNVYGC